MHLHTPMSVVIALCIALHVYNVSTCINRTLLSYSPHRKLKSDRKALPLLADRFSTGQMFSWDVLNQERMKWMKWMKWMMMMMVMMMMKNDGDE